MNLDEQPSNQLENYSNNDLPEQIQSIMNLSQSKENPSVEWETDESQIINSKLYATME